MRGQDAVLTFKLLNPCPVCDAETVLAEIEPHPLHVNFEIQGYLCDRCGPIKWHYRYTVGNATETSVRSRFSKGAGQEAVIQAIATTAPDLPPEPGVHATFAREHEYKRHSRVSLLAGIDLVTGKVPPLVKDRHRSREFIEFLKLLE